ncbi:taste receptor type 2 member 42 [Pteropus alecto]|uniref:taste receptor type 2 member 42 n=1 Tax=Pteropus alecto TaxID=9402 RepID=UPI000D53684D|nr:taste receptor type 2 member 42 [Pteropus alecto]
MLFCNSLIINLSLRCSIRNLDFFFSVKMPTGLDIIFVILSIAEFTIGILGNVFIGLVNCSEWVKNQKISLANFILTCLAIFRISQLLVLLFKSLILGLSLHLHLTYTIAKLMSLLWRITDHLTTWLATCLSIFYLLKIAYFSHPLFLWLKLRLNRVIPVTFLFSLFFLIVDFLLLEIFNDFFLNVYILDKSNLTLFIVESKTHYVETLILLSLTCFFPIVLSLTSLLLLFLSLVRHIRNLQLNSMSSRDSSTEAHKKAIRMVMSFFFLFIVHFFSIQVASWLFLMTWINKFAKFAVLAVYIFPSGHPFILIVGNSQLRQTILKVLWHLKSFSKRENLLQIYR